MIIIADKIDKLDFNKLRYVYAQDIEIARRKNYRELSPDEGRLCAERDFFRYLDEVFFMQSSARVFVYEQSEAYLSAVRFESYKDGLVLNSLVTAPNFRRKGYALKLLAFAFDHLPQLPIYSHIHYGNKASIRLHEELGFLCLKDYAHMLDGSVRSDHYTYIKYI